MTLARKIKSNIDYPELLMEDFVSLIEDQDYEPLMNKLNELIDQLNFLNKNISVTNNFGGYIFEESWEAGETKKVQHFLGVKPQYRIILRQEGNGILSDIPSEWDNKVISILNNGSSTVTATILVLKE